MSSFDRPVRVGSVPIASWADVRYELRLLLALLFGAAFLRLLPMKREGLALRVLLRAWAQMVLERRREPQPLTTTGEEVPDGA